jgi:dolichol-phosphate mannosyltransferase
MGKTHQSLVAVVVPCYKVSAQICGVLNAIGPEVDKIYVVDDQCPESSGALVEQKIKDPRVKVIFLPENLGVGGATLAGFHAAFEDKVEIAVKLDGDGQMDPSLIPLLIQPLLAGQADFTKGNRFYSPRHLRQMPAIRLIGNAGISFIAKLTTGYWNVMDTTNGFIGIQTALLPFLEAERMEKRYFFENDLLFRLCLLRAVVQEVPMSAQYGEEKSNLSVSKSLLSFPLKFLTRFWSRIFYRYFLRDFNAASLMFLFGSLFTLGGALFGIYKWHVAESAGLTATSGTVMLAGLPIILGFQMLLYAILYDITTVPTQPIYPALRP